VPADEAVLAALQKAHDLEATASEKWHKQEHEFKQSMKRYPKLGKYFDRRHKEAYDRQHDLRSHIMRLGGTVETNLGDTTYTGDVKRAFDDSCALLDELADCYVDIIDAAKEAGDRWTREKFHGYIKDLKQTYAKGEQRLQQLKDLGLPLFLSKHV
jgi:bacterioferritin (cytochrome b1)